MINGILFDSGDTLVRPVGGEWFPGPRFGEILRAHKLTDPPPDDLRLAIEEGSRHLHRNQHVPSLQQEIEQFRRFYDIILTVLGVKDRRSLSLDLARDIVLGQNLEPFPDTSAGLEGLRDLGQRLGIVSNTWPSTDRKYRELGIRHYFDCFVVSTLVGSVKPDQRIFECALEAFQMPAREILFVDDDPVNVRAANHAGMNGVLMARNGAPAEADQPYVTTMAEIATLLAAGA